MVVFAGFFDFLLFAGELIELNQKRIRLQQSVDEVRYRLLRLLNLNLIQTPPFLLFTPSGKKAARDFILMAQKNQRVLDGRSCLKF